MSETALIVCLMSILFLLFIALTERKVFAYVMRRIGPVLMGRNGAFQIAADLIKCLSKELFFIPRPTSALVNFPTLILSELCLGSFYVYLRERRLDGTLPSDINSFRKHIFLCRRSPKPIAVRYSLDRPCTCPRNFFGHFYNDSILPASPYRPVRKLPRLCLGPKCLLILFPVQSCCLRLRDNFHTRV
jgi:hypothetical protein